MSTLELASYAKINLTLEVSGKRPDGYHDLDSVAQVIDLADTLSISRADAGLIEVEADAPGVPSGPQNLVYRACEAFLEATGIRAGARFTLRKRIPAQAGLGGGSSNAAAAVIGLNRLYGAGLAEDDLARIVARVGSDAPLFIYGGTVRMRGRGELVEPLPDAPGLHLLVVKPDVGVSTAWAYSELDRLGGRPPVGASDRAEAAVRRGDISALLSSLHNDFDAVVAQAYTEVAEAERMLCETGAQRVMLCGSGSAVFGVFESREAALRAQDRLGGSAAWSAVTRSLSRQMGK